MGDASECVLAGRPGGDLLSRALRHSTMGAGGFHGRVRDGIGWLLPAMATRSSSEHASWTRGAWVGCGRFWCAWLRRMRVAAWALVAQRVDGCCAWRLVGGAFEPIGRLGPVSACVAALTHPAYRRDGLSRPSGRHGFEVGFPLRCFQRLSRPYIATRRCRWRDNRSTRGMSIPVLSY